MQHLGLLLVLRIDEVELNHQLAAVADAERQGVLAGIELVESLLSLGLKRNAPAIPWQSPTRQS